MLLAAIMNDKDRAAGRSGVGAVMGSKKLKAIVVKATRKKLDNIADLDALKVAAKNAMDVLKANPVTGSGLRQLGTAVLVNIVNNIGAFPTKNWQESYYDKGDDISGETLAEKYLVKPGACHRCPSPAAAWSMSMARSSEVLNTSPCGPMAATAATMI